MRLRVITPLFAVPLVTALAVWLQLFTFWGTTAPWTAGVINLLMVGCLLGVITTMRTSMIDDLRADYEQWVREEVNYRGTKKLTMLQQLSLPSDCWADYNKSCLTLFAVTDPLFDDAMESYAEWWWRPLDIPSLDFLKWRAGPVIHEFKKMTPQPRD